MSKDEHDHHSKLFMLGLQAVSALQDVGSREPSKIQL
jgi:hypothetical protein